MDSSNHFLLFHCKESSFEGQNRDSFDDTNHPELTSVTLGQLYLRVAYRGTTTFASIEQHVGKSTGSSTPSIGNKTLRLVTWNVSGKASLLKVFQKGLQNVSQMQGDQALRLFTNRLGANGMPGVVNRKLTCRHDM